MGASCYLSARLRSAGLLVDPLVLQAMVPCCSSHRLHAHDVKGTLWMPGACRDLIFFFLKQDMNHGG